MVVGSIPAADTRNAVVAQSVEHQTFNLGVTGSIPVSRTNNMERVAQQVERRNNGFCNKTFQQFFNALGAVMLQVRVLPLSPLKLNIKGELFMGLGCKPCGKLQSIFRKLDNELAKKAAMEKLDKNKDASKEKSKE